MSRPASRTSPRRVARRRPPAGAVLLAPGDWTVLALVLVERLSLHEAACALETTPAEVRRRYERALARLRRAIAPWLSSSRRETPVASRRAS